MDTVDLEENFKKLTQKLQSVYRSIKAKNDSDDMDMQKEEFIKLFCKTFDWTAEYDEEDEDGLQFVDENDENGREDGFVDLEDQDGDNKKQATNNNNNNKNQDKASQAKEEKEKSVGSPASQNLDGSSELTALVTSVSVEKDNLENEAGKQGMTISGSETDTNSETAQEKLLTPRGRMRLEHGSFSNSKQSVSSMGMASKNDRHFTTEELERSDMRNNNSNSSIRNFIGTDKIMMITPQNVPLVDILNHNVYSNRSESYFDASPISENERAAALLAANGKLMNEANAINNDGTNNVLPSLAALGNFSETAKLLAGDIAVARRLAMSVKDNEWIKNKLSPAFSNGLSDDGSIQEPDKLVFAPSTIPTNTKTSLHDGIGLEINGNEKMKNANGTATVESQTVRRMLRKLILVLLARHPNGLYEDELKIECQKVAEDISQLDENIQYLLFNHRNVLITPCNNRGNLLTLNHQAIPTIMEEYTTPEISGTIAEHINAIIKLFPGGISADVLDETMFNFYGYKLSQIIPNVQQFVISQCKVIAAPDENSLVYLPFAGGDVKPTLQHSQVLSTAVGYRELLIALLAHHEKPINAQELEREFSELFDMQLNACSPVINRILKKINDPILNQEQKQLQAESASQVLDAANARNNLRSSIRNSYSSLKSMITKFRLAENFELHYEKNRSLFELFCPKCKQDTTVVKSPFKEDHRTVFMGGFAHGTSTKELEEALARYGAKMVDCKGISYRNYGWSFVKLETAQQAEDLIANSPIQIRSRNIDVRPFIDRKRVKNHEHNRPSSNDLLMAVQEAVRQSPSGLTVAQIQTHLFHKFQFRVDGPEITKLVSKNAKLLQIKRHPIERVVLTPKMHRLSMEELKWKILKIWNTTSNLQEGADENDPNQDGDDKQPKEQKVLSLADFENEFARRYKAFLDPRLYGYHSIYNLFQSMSDILCFPQIHSQSRSQQQQQGNSAPAPPPTYPSAIPVVTRSTTMPSISTTMPTLTNSMVTIDSSNSQESRTISNTSITITPTSMGSNITDNTRKMVLPNTTPTIGLESMDINNGSAAICTPNGLMNTVTGVSIPGFPSLPVYPNATSINLVNNPRFPVTMMPMPTYSADLMLPTGDTKTPWPTLENNWSLPSIPMQPQPFFLPSMSNLGAFSNRSLRSQSPGTEKLQTDILSGNPNVLPLFNQLSNGSQFGKQATSG